MKRLYAVVLALFVCTLVVAGILASGAYSVVAPVQASPMGMQTGSSKAEFAANDLMQEIKKVLPRVSPRSAMCILCHAKVTPGIVAAWLHSKHAQVTVREAWSKPPLEREISSLPPKEFQDYVVGCYECHGLNPDIHPDTFDHFGQRVHVIVTPNDCKVCHAAEVDQYQRSTKAHAYYNLVKNPVYMMLVKAANLVGKEAGGEAAMNVTCFKCHGTKVTVVGWITVKWQNVVIKVPKLSGWPNHGVGRVNPDGSLGSCEACHPAHSFSIAVARSPYTCAQCHLEPDVPGFNVWMENKMGNIWLVEHKQYNLTHVPWVVGVDFRVPSCAACHFSLLVDPQGNVIVHRTHNVDERIYVRLFGAYAHPTPKHGATWKIVNADGLPLPYTLDGRFATEYLISPEEQKARKETLMRICKACHVTTFVENHFKELDKIIEETNKAMRYITSLLLKAYKKKLADPSYLFDEHIERMWLEAWLFYANSIRYGTAMAGPDYTTFKLGWYKLSDLAYQMEDYMKFLEKARGS